jgi:hypothetical protein
MKRRSRTGGEPTKAQRRKTGARKSRITPKAVRPRSSSAAGQQTKLVQFTSELNEALEVNGIVAWCALLPTRRDSASRFCLPSAMS